MRSRLSISIFLFFLLGTITAQSITDDLAFYGDVMVNAFKPEHRERGLEQFETYVSQYIKDQTYKADNWEAVKNYTRILANKDSSLIIITWQSNTGGYPSQYGGYLINEGNVTPLNQSSTLDRDSQYTTYGTDDWYGALYYNLMPLKGQKNAYLLFGYQHNAEHEKTKLMDVITLSNGDVTFGSEIFVVEHEDSRDDVKQRFLHQYSADANATLNYNEQLDMVIFDHLMPGSSSAGPGVNTLVPDGTYEGYKFKGGKFYYVEKIFDHVYEEAPRPAPVFNEGTKKDILGRSKN